MFEFNDRLERSMERFEAFFNFDIADRPPVNISLWKNSEYIHPKKKYDTLEDKWLDFEFRIEEQVAKIDKALYIGDSYPIIWPNLGPEIYSAWCGCGYNYGENTTWSEPCIHDWEKDADKGNLNRNHPLLIKMIEYTDMLLEASNGRFIVGLTDFHPGGDHIAALRDPQELCIDMIENLENVRKKLDESYPEYFETYDFFYNKLRTAGMPITSWTPLLSEKKFYIPSNDFSCMVSKETFDDLFMPGIIEECRFLDRSIYHLDGPGALRHLDSLLDIHELNAVQWVCGAGNEGFERWLPVYKKIQKAGKAAQLILDIKDLDLLFENLEPRGIWLSWITGIDSIDTAEKVMKRVEKWK
ncbi:MAG: hypothetical protein JXN10_07045 [Clostridia bacterium]|nr:hypothetical protein [Clostridia bacterium]MBN2883268.1 hypothetical protein [Clostridia bacterium]